MDGKTTAPKGAAHPTHIMRLPPEMVERIAAGEVIERPVSVVRELLDNALDAGARSVRIEIRQGGIRLIRVSDDGRGIPSDDLPLAYAPHATSKVAALADLEHITTLGFRGEALASIAAVAEIEIASSSDDGGIAATVSTRPGQHAEMGTTARPPGTTVTVRELFATVPARHAMLRGPRTEAARINTLVRAYALVHTAVRFSLASDGQLVLQTFGDGLAATVSAIYGSDIERALLWLGSASSQEAQIEGIVASRGFSHPSRDHIVVAVNGRPVSNRTLFAALEAGYRPLLRKGRHPLLVVRVMVPPERLDANVHPAKSEVLLRDDATIVPLLRDGVHQALGSVPHVAVTGSHLGDALPSHPVQLRLPLAHKRRGLLLGERRIPYGAVLSGRQSEEALTRLPPLEALAQFDDALILARAIDGHLYLVDQHRAHERAIYEQLARHRGTLIQPPHDGQDAAPADPAPTPPAGQLLLEPVLVELTPRQASMLEPRLDELATLGIECQPFGGSMFLVRSVPEMSGTAQSPAAFARALAEDAGVDSDDWLDHLCISLACRSAIRRGLRITTRQQQALLDGLREVVAPAVCPHGSPLILRLTRSYLARAFDW